MRWDIVKHFLKFVVISIIIVVAAFALVEISDKYKVNVLRNNVTWSIDNKNCKEAVDFDKDEEISTHAAGGDALVTVLEGTGKFTIGGEIYILNEGESIIMPRDIPHAVYGQEKFKMLLVVSF